MDNLKQMTLQQIIAIARLTEDPVDFGKKLLSYVGAELSTAIREELNDRDEKLKLMRKETKVLAIAFER